MSAAQDKLEVKRLGRTTYAEVHELQQELLTARVEGKVGDVLILTEHEPVLTIGRGQSSDDFEGLSIPVIEVERGGEATYHGPGQVVAYPIFLLPEGRRDLHRYLRDLEQVVIGVLSEFDVEGRRVEDLTGVWIGEQKVCSIGIAVRRWVTWHGLALNISTDLAAFGGFHPCGLDPRVMTRLGDHAQLPPGNILVEVLLVKHFCEVFGLELPDPPAPRRPEVDDNGFPSLPLLP